ncbi:amidohydrolase family protein [Streptomyces sp. NPDC055092]
MHGFTAVDVHAHHLNADVVPPDPTAPHLVIEGPDGGRIMRGQETFRDVQPVLWDVSLRLAEMDRSGISHQVISPVPVTMEHACAPTTDPDYARSLNESIATATAASGGRLLGLGCLPLHDIKAALAELERCQQIGLLGVEVGTRVGDLDLDAPQLDEFWHACDASGAAVFVHPVHGGREVVRRAGAPYDLGVGMLTDTALAASALVFGGVLSRHERVRIALAHGCGAFPWAFPRLEVAAELAAQGTDTNWIELARRLYADTLVFDDEHLRLLVHRFGAGQLLLGSDAPFFPDQMAKSMQSVQNALHSGALPSGTDHVRLARNALDFLGLSDPAEPGAAPSATEGAA